MLALCLALCTVLEQSELFHNEEGKFIQSGNTQKFFYSELWLSHLFQMFSI